MSEKVPRIRSVATTYKGTVIAIGEWEKQVYIWNLETGSKVSEFETILETQALPLASWLAISRDGNLCAAGAYERHGVAMYKAATGERLWQRKDLKKSGHLVFSQHWPILFVVIEDRPCHLLNLTNGETVGQLRDVEEIEESPFANIALVVRHAGLDLLDMTTQRRLMRIPKTTFGVLDVVFTETTVVVSESTGPVSSYSLQDGRLTWRHTPPPENHVVHLGYVEQTSEVLGINWPYQHGGDHTLLAFKRDAGDIVRRFVVRGHAGDFALGGTHLITWTGEVIDTLTGEVVSVQDFPR